MSAYDETARTWPSLQLDGVITMPWPGRSQPIRVDSRRAPLAVRIARDIVRQPDGCWRWTGPADRDGYARFKVCGRDTRLNRVVWELANDAELTVDQVVRHTCDQPACLNPDHLISGSVGDNNRDRDLRDRSAHGERHYAAKLTEEQVRTIRQRVDGGERRNKLAAEYGVSRQLISRITLRQVWARVA